MWSDTRPLRELCNVIVDCPHSTPAWTASGYVVIRNQNIKNGRLDLSTPSFTDAVHFAHRIRRAKPTAGDIIFTREAPMGEVCMVPKDLECCVGQRQVLLRPNTSIVDGRFLLYALQSPQVQDEIGWNEGTGSTVSNVRIPVLEALRIPVPPLSIQREVGGLLGALDDRIDLLRETNATLEAIAQALFKSWFVDFDPVRAKQEGREPEGMDAETAAMFPSSFDNSEIGSIPTGWPLGTLGDVALVVRAHARPAELGPAVNYVGLEHIPRKCLSLTDWSNAEEVESAKSRFDCGDILFGKLRPYFHKVVIAPIRGVCSTDVLVLRSSQPEFYGLTVMTLFSKPLIDYADRLSNGAKMPRVNWDDLSAYQLAIPDARIAAQYQKIAGPLFEQILANTHRVRTLGELRDALLPRLISGRLRLPEAEEQFNEALTGT